MERNEHPSVDIVTPIHNRSQYLAPLYYSIASQDIIKNWIVIDDGSDDSPEIVIESLPKLSSLNIVYRRIAKSGINSAMNVAFSLLSSDYFLKVDSDDLLSNDFSCCFRKAYTILKEQSKLSCVYGFSFRTSSPSGELIGKLDIPYKYRISTNPPIYICKYSYIRVYGDKSYGDLADCFESEMVKHHFRYPSFAHETHAPASLLHVSCEILNSNSSIAFIDCSVKIKEYLPDGISSLKLNSLEKNPQAYLLLALHHASFPLLSLNARISILKSILRAIFYITLGFMIRVFR